jgi:hypothetical protein
MNRREYYSDRKMRFIFEITPLQLLEAKAGEPDFDLEDHRFCYACERWFNAAYWIAQIDCEGEADLVCSGCADGFERAGALGKQEMFARSANNYKFYVRELRDARKEAA